MADLFDTFPSGGSAPDAPRSTRAAPLADRIRPKTLSEVIGQGKVLDRDGPLGAMRRRAACPR